MAEHEGQSRSFWLGDEPEVCRKEGTLRRGSVEKRSRVQAWRRGNVQGTQVEHEGLPLPSFHHLRLLSGISLVILKLGCMLESAGAARCRLPRDSGLVGLSASRQGAGPAF